MIIRFPKLLTFFVATIAFLPIRAEESSTNLEDEDDIKEFNAIQNGIHERFEQCRKEMEEQRKKESAQNEAENVYGSPVQSSLMFQDIELSDALAQSIWDMAPGAIKSLITSMQSPERSAGAIPQVIVLYGPHGSGKSKIAALLAQKTNRKLIFINSAFLGTTYLNSETTNLGEAIALLAKLNVPCVIVIDEADILSKTNQEYGHQGTRLDAAMAQLLDTYENNPNLFFVWTTNNVGQLEEKFLDRIGNNIYKIENPTANGREKIINFYLSQNPQIRASAALNIQALAKKTRGYSIRRLKDLIKEAHRIAASREGDMCVTQHDLDEAYNHKNALEKKVDRNSRKDRLIRHVRDHSVLYNVGVPAALSVGGALFTYFIVNRSSMNQQNKLAEQQRKQAENLADRQLKQTETLAEKSSKTTQEEGSKARGTGYLATATNLAITLAPYGPFAVGAGLCAHGACAVLMNHWASNQDDKI